jgi:glycosyltransferase involved in cell wall biosynthesis
MKILAVPGVDWLSALQNRSHQIFERLSKKHEVHIFRLKMKNQKIEERQNIFLHESYTIPHSGFTSFYVFNLLPYLRKINKIIIEHNIDLVVTSDLIVGSGAVMIARQLGVPTVYDYDDFMPEFIRHYLSSPIIRDFGYGLGTFLNSYLIRNSDHVITVGTLLKEHAEQMNKNVTLIPNGVDLNLFNPEKVNGSIIRKKLKINEDGFVIGYVGGFGFWVALTDVVRAFASFLSEHPNSFLMLVGPYSVRTPLRAKNIIITGRVPYPEVPFYIKSMDVCVLPFRPSIVAHASSPMKLNEYAAMRKPIICTPLRDAHLAYGDSLIYALTENQFKTAFAVLYEDTELRKQLGEKARKIVETNFNWNVLAEAYEKVLMNTSFKGKKACT